MQFDLTTFARRSATLLAMIGLASCDSTRPVDATGGSAVPRQAPGFASRSLSPVSVGLVNPSFEGGATGWAHGDVDFVGSGSWHASDGNGSVDLNGFFPGWISQDFPTVPGTVYTVLFDLAGNPGSPQGVKPLEVSAAGTTTPYSFDTQGKSSTNMGWTTQTFSFTATGATTTLKFTSLYSGNGSFPDRAQGAAVDNIRISFIPPAAPTTTAVTFGSGPFVYSGTTFTATASVSPAAAGGASIVYSGDCINAGNSCTATATFAGSDGYAASSASTTITIDKAPTVTAITCPASVTYTTAAQTPCTTIVTGPGLNDTPAATYTNNTDVGTATASYTFPATANLLSSSDSKTFTIGKAASTTTVEFVGTSFVYNGTKFEAHATVSPAGAGTATLAYTGNCVDAGTTCTATATFAGSDGYAASSASATITIDKAATTTAVSCPASQTYTAAALTPCTVSVTGPGLSTTPSAAYANNTNAGTATASYTFSGTSNLLPSSGSKTFAINPAGTTTTVSCSNVTYTGSALTPCSVTVTGPGLSGATAPLQYSNNTNAGTASASATFAATQNLSASSDSKSFTIARAATTTAVTFGSGPFWRTGVAFTATASVSPAAAGTATIAYSGDCINAGNTCTATAAYAGNANFLSSGASTSIVIKLPVVVSGEQCKQGGWVYLTDDLGNLFKNQGDCVSYVATKGKNKGAGGD